MVGIPFAFKLPFRFLTFSMTQKKVLVLVNHPTRSDFLNEKSSSLGEFTTSTSVFFWVICTKRSLFFCCKSYSFSCSFCATNWAASFGGQRITGTPIFSVTSVERMPFTIRSSNRSISSSLMFTERSVEYVLSRFKEMQLPPSATKLTYRSTTAEMRRASEISFKPNANRSSNCLGIVDVKFTYNLC